MMSTEHVTALSKEARGLQEKALEYAEAGKLRHAVEKAWDATLLASNAMILAHTGKIPEGDNREIERGLAFLHSKGPEFERLKVGFSFLNQYQGGMCISGVLKTT